MVLALVCQACSYSATVVGHRPCSQALPSVDAFYASSSALMGAAMLMSERPDHDDDQVIGDVFRWAGKALLGMAIPFALSARHGFHSAREC